MEEENKKKKRTPLAARGFKELSPERKEELRLKAMQKRASWTLAYQLGYYVGQQIVDRFLPTLSVDMLQTRKVISVTAGEGDECKRLDKIWHDGYDENDKNKAESPSWLALRAYHEMLEAKYLKPTIDCHFQLLNVTEEHMADFKRGVGVALWDCDCSHYSTKPENIEVIADEEGWFTNIKLKRA